MATGGPGGQHRHSLHREQEHQQQQLECEYQQQQRRQREQGGGAQQPSCGAQATAFLRRHVDVISLLLLTAGMLASTVAAHYSSAPPIVVLDSHSQSMAGVAALFFVALFLSGFALKRLYDNSPAGLSLRVAVLAALWYGAAIAAGAVFYALTTSIIVLTACLFVPPVVLLDYAAYNLIVDNGYKLLAPAAHRSPPLAPFARSLLRGRLPRRDYLVCAALLAALALSVTSALPIVLGDAHAWPGWLLAALLLALPSALFAMEGWYYASAWSAEIATAVALNVVVIAASLFVWFLTPHRAPAIWPVLVAAGYVVVVALVFATRKLRLDQGRVTHTTTGAFVLAYLAVMAALIAVAVLVKPVIIGVGLLFAVTLLSATPLAVRRLWPWLRTRFPSLTPLRAVAPLLLLLLGFAVVASVSGSSGFIAFSISWGVLFTALLILMLYTFGDQYTDSSLLALTPSSAAVSGSAAQAGADSAAAGGKGGASEALMWGRDSLRVTGLFFSKALLPVFEYVANTGRVSPLQLRNGRVLLPLALTAIVYIWGVVAAYFISPPTAGLCVSSVALLYFATSLLMWRNSVNSELAAAVTFFGGPDSPEFAEALRAAQVRALLAHLPIARSIAVPVPEPVVTAVGAGDGATGFVLGGSTLALPASAHASAPGNGAGPGPLAPPQPPPPPPPPHIPLSQGVVAGIGPGYGREQEQNQGEDQGLGYSVGLVTDSSSVHVTYYNDPNANFTPAAPRSRAPTFLAPLPALPSASTNSDESNSPHSANARGPSASGRSPVRAPQPPPPPPPPLPASATATASLLQVPGAYSHGTGAGGSFVPRPPSLAALGHPEAHSNDNDGDDDGDDRGAPAVGTGVLISAPGATFGANSASDAAAAAAAGGGGGARGPRSVGPSSRIVSRSQSRRPSADPLAASAPAAAATVAAAAALPEEVPVPLRAPIAATGGGEHAVGSSPPNGSSIGNGNRSVGSSGSSRAGSLVPPSPASPALPSGYTGALDGLSGIGRPSTPGAPAGDGHASTLSSGGGVSHDGAAHGGAARGGVGPRASVGVTAGVGGVQWSDVGAAELYGGYDYGADDGEGNGGGSDDDYGGGRDERKDDYDHDDTDDDDYHDDYHDDGSDGYYGSNGSHDVGLGMLATVPSAIPQTNDNTVGNANNADVSKDGDNAAGAMTAVASTLNQPTASADASAAAKTAATAAVTRPPPTRAPVLEGDETTALSRWLHSPQLTQRQTELLLSRAEAAVRTEARFRLRLANSDFAADAWGGGAGSSSGSAAAGAAVDISRADASVEEVSIRSLADAALLDADAVARARDELLAAIPPLFTAVCCDRSREQQADLALADAATTAAAGAGRTRGSRQWRGAGPLGGAGRTGAGSDAPASSPMWAYSFNNRRGNRNRSRSNANALTGVSFVQDSAQQAQGQIPLSVPAPAPASASHGPTLNSSSSASAVASASASGGLVPPMPKGTMLLTAPLPVNAASVGAAPAPAGTAAPGKIGRAHV